MTTMRAVDGVDLTAPRFVSRIRLRDDPRDEVDFALPLGKLGELLSAGFVESKLKLMYDYRHEITRRILESRESTRNDAD
jgi:hypothetical protein